MQTREEHKAAARKLVGKACANFHGFYPKWVAQREYNNGTEAGDEAGETKTPSTLHFDASHSPQLHHDVCFIQSSVFFWGVIQ